MSSKGAAALREQTSVGIRRHAPIAGIPECKCCIKFALLHHGDKARDRQTDIAFNLGLARSNDLGRSIFRLRADLANRKQPFDHVSSPFRRGVSLMHQLLRLRSPRGMNSKQMNADAMVLRNLNTDANVLISGKQECVRYGFEPCKLNEIGDDKRINAFLLTVTVNEAESKLYIVHRSQNGLIGSRPGAANCTVVPVDSKQATVGRMPLGDGFQFGNCDVGNKHQGRAGHFRAGYCGSALRE